MTIVDVRCPINPSRLFMRLRRDPNVRIDPGDNLIEVLCRDCGGVLHRYNILGELVETVRGKRPGPVRRKPVRRYR